jgi:phosphoribosyl 1,2-cyclic phosphodiesterase
MNFKPVASSSRGNCYLLESPGVPSLLIEAGIPVKAVREALGFTLSDIAGCLISHEHGDHSKGVKDLLKAGVDVYTSQETAAALGISDHHRHVVISSEHVYSMWDWKVLPFGLHHDVPCHGFMIASPDGDRLLFIPDTSYIRNRFAGINIIAIEANYVADQLSENIHKGAVPASLGHRVRRNHMSLDSVIAMLKANDLSACREIWLLHLSDQNSDEARMVRAVQKATGIPCRACAE